MTAGKFYGDAKKNKGIQTSQDKKFYAISSEFKPFSNKDKPLVVQFTVKHEQSIDCGGGYVKLFDCSLNAKDMNGDSPYQIMFGNSLKIVLSGVVSVKLQHVFTTKFVYFVIIEF